MMQYTDDVLWNCIFETYIIILTYVSPQNLIKLKKKIPGPKGKEKKYLDISQFMVYMQYHD